MKRLLLIILFLPVVFALRAQQPLAPVVPFDTGAGQADLDTMTQRLVRRVADRAVDWPEAVRIAALLGADGAWADVNYALDAPGFPIMPHLRRMVLLARAVTDSRSPLCGDREVIRRLGAAFDRYLRWYAADPRIDNWWYRDIGAPQEYAEALLLLKPVLRRDELLRLAAYIEDRTVNWAHRGKNRTWVSMISLMKACTVDDVKLAEKAVASIASTAEYALRQGDEGFKFDGSIHQHRPQVYSGGYGLSLVTDLSEFIYLTRGTAFRALFTPEKCNLLARAMLGGTQLFGYRGAIDFGVIGRGISRPGSSVNIDPAVLDIMALNDPEHAADFRAWKAHIVEGKPFPASGNKHFWCSDIMTHHGADYYLSVKIPSARTVGTEQLNRENLRGFNLPMGATNIQTSGHEYTDIFAVWDWTRVPGTTALQCADSARLEGYMFGRNEFGGGVSDGSCGVMAFEYDYRGLEARKAYFLFGDRMLCLGNSISSGAESGVATSVNQTFLNGEIVVADARGEHTVQPGTCETLAGPVRVRHADVEYLFPESQPVMLSACTQQGRWGDINEVDSGGEVVKAPVFSLWLDHGQKPSGAHYRYIVAPRAGSLPMDGGFDIQTDTASQMVVRDRNSGLTAVVFFRPGTADLGDGVKLSSDEKILLLLKKTPSGIRISWSDPLSYRKTATLTFSVPAEEENGCRDLKPLRLNFPQYPDLGRTTTKEFKL